MIVNGENSLAKPDITLTNLTEYITQDLLPILESKYNQTDLHLLSEQEPGSKKNINIHDHHIYKQVNELSRDKEKEKTKLKQKVEYEKYYDFAKGCNSPLPLYVMKFKNGQISIDLHFKEEEVKVIMRWSATSDDARRKSITNYSHLNFDSSNPVHFSIKAGYLTNEKKSQIETCSKNNINVSIQVMNLHKEIASFSYKSLEYKGVLSFFSSSKPPLGYFLILKLSYFCVDLSMIEVYDDLLNAKICEVELLNEDLMAEIDVKSKKTLDKLQKIKIIKEELAIEIRKSKKSLEIDRKEPRVGVSDIRFVVSPSFMLSMFIFGFVLSLIDLSNPGFINRLII